MNYPLERRPRTSRNWAMASYGVFARIYAISQLALTHFPCVSSVDLILITPLAYYPRSTAYRQSPCLRA